MKRNIIELHLPDYHKKDVKSLDVSGQLIDNCLLQHFTGQIAVRGVSMIDHPDLEVDVFIKLILQHGTDKYDENREGIHPDLDHTYAIGLHATAMEITDHIVCPHYDQKSGVINSTMGQVLYDCHYGAIMDRGYALHLSLLLVYDLKALRPIFIEWTDEEHQHADTEESSLDTCAFQFKSDKKKALLGVIHLI